MKKRGWAAIAAVCLILRLLAWAVPVSAAETPEGLYAQAAVVMEAKTGRILYEKNGNEQRAMASTTKLMTMVIALEYGDFSKPVTVSERAASQPKVNMSLRTGETFRLKDLLYALMLQSCNDAAVAIAEAVAGSVEEFCWLMNMKAVSLGAVQTHFATPNGLDREDHYSTAVDMALISRYVLGNEEAMAILKTPSYTIAKDAVNSRSVSLVNKNPLLTSYAGAIGGKTGFTAKAGLCLVGMAQRDGVTLIAVVLGAGWPPHSTYRVRDCQKLFEYAFTRYRFASLPVSERDTGEPVEVHNGRKDRVSTCVSGEAEYYLCEEDLWELEYDLPYVVEAPVRKGQVLGSAALCINGQAVAYLAVTAAEDVPRRTWLDYFKQLLQEDQVWSACKSLWPTAASVPGASVKNGLPQDG